MNENRGGGGTKEEKKFEKTVYIVILSSTDAEESLKLQAEDLKFQFGCDYSTLYLELQFNYKSFQLNFLRGI